MKKKYTLTMVFEADPENYEFIEFKNQVLSGEMKRGLNEEGDLTALTINLEEIK